MTTHTQRIKQTYRKARVVGGVILLAGTLTASLFPGLVAQAQTTSDLPPIKVNTEDCIAGLVDISAFDGIHKGAAGSCYNRDHIIYIRCSVAPDTSYSALINNETNFPRRYNGWAECPLGAKVIDVEIPS